MPARRSRSERRDDVQGGTTSRHRWGVRLATSSPSPRLGTIHPPKEYIERKRSEGKTHREALRALKRQLVRTVFRLLQEGAASARILCVKNGWQLPHAPHDLPTGCDAQGQDAYALLVVLLDGPETGYATVPLTFSDRHGDDEHP